ncbi:hypothetical protein [Bartonella raoultii]|uniref:Protein-disulfide reductase n=1 Tax=Bartonella raoultii TaxID=1457020 RepID=A0ABS7I5H9_9HYPH|nr:hypothetical protein [Bartonella raoultii]MBX4336123.1 hypothetical protein [Bartonella raoultii]
MTKSFQNYILSILITIVFSFSQIVSVHASHLENNSQKEKISITEQGMKNPINTISFYTSILNYGVKHETPIEGKIEKVFEPITIGTFGIGMALGYGSSTVGLFLGWLIAKMVMMFK